MSDVEPGERGDQPPSMPLAFLTDDEGMLHITWGGETFDVEIDGATPGMVVELQPDILERLIQMARAEREQRERAGLS